MGVLKRLYRAGIILKREPCSNWSLSPCRITFTETYSPSFAKLFDEWVAHVRTGCGDDIDTGINTEPTN